MEKYCPECRKVFENEDYLLCPYCGTNLKSRVGRQPIPRELRHKVLQRDNYRCVECGATNKETTLEIEENLQKYGNPYQVSEFRDYSFQVRKCQP